MAETDLFGERASAPARRTVTDEQGSLFGSVTRTLVPVLVPLPIDRAYTYALPEGLDAPPGSIVAVPLGPRLIPGVVWDEADDAETEGGQSTRDGTLDPKKIREVATVFDCPPLPAPLRRFIDWTANWTLTPPGLVAKMVLRVPTAFDPEPHIAALRLTDERPKRMTAAREAVVEMASNGEEWTKSGLANAANVTPSVVDGLVKAGTFETVMLPPPPVVAPPRIDFGAPDLSDQQRRAADELRERITGSDFSVTLLEGVTGSGKTEVYFEAVAQAIDAGRQVLILLPEIALTKSFLDRFEKRFGTRPAEWHSDVPPRMRERVWRQVAEGQVRVVAGARSSLFLPFPDLGLTIVDEEHDPAYKQEDGVRYHARDMAIVRASLSGAPVIVASATPSVETQVNAADDRFAHVLIPGRFGDAVLPELRTIDMRAHPPERGGFLSPQLVGAMDRALKRGEQSLLFLNRRGYAPLTLCRVCGYRYQCPNCSTWLVEHRFRRHLMCHHCGHTEHSPEHCRECGTLDHLVPCGPGVERLAEEVDAHFPTARIVVLSSDIQGGARRVKLELEAIADGQADIVIGTQMVAKGHNFPRLSLVGVVDADLGLAHGDPRAAERTYQTLTQVTGRAGRFGLKSIGLLQTYQPDHPVMRAIVSGDQPAFYEREIKERRREKLPPFGRLAALIVSADTRADAEDFARKLRRAAPVAPGIEVLGPAEAPLALIRGRYRFRLLVRGDLSANLQTYIRAMRKDAGPERGTVRVAIDIDPQSFV